MTLSILALITTLLGTFAKLTPLIIDAVNKHYETQANKKEQHDEDIQAIAIASHDPDQSSPLHQRLADRVLKYKARLAALGGFQRPHS